jgi:uroporphyrinogen-III decarboxylase
VAGEILETTRFFYNATEGRLPIQMPDMQGPLDLAANMLGTERLMMEMYDHPASVHRLLERMTNDFINYMQLQKVASGDTLVPIHCMPTVWLPHGRGMSLSEDMLAVISRRFYPTFARPYNERLADAFGQVVIHSCGSWEHNLAGLAQTRGLLGVNFGVSETDPERVAAQFGQRVVLLMHHTTVTCKGLRHFSTTEFVDWVFDFVNSHALRAIPLLVPDPDMTAEQCAEVAQMARRRAQRA